MSEPENNTQADQVVAEPSGFEIVANLLERQDEVLVQLDELNGRVEAAIKAIIASRESWIEAEGSDDNASSQAAEPEASIPVSQAA